MSFIAAGFGVDWTSLLYFYDESDKASGPKYAFTDSDLRIQLRAVTKEDETISQIWTYSHKLQDWQLYQGLFMYHEFAVLVTSDAWWWSLEKNTEGLTIQRSRSKDVVVDTYRDQNRLTPVTIRKEAAVGKMKMEALIDWLYIHDELNTDYNVMTSNCQDFAKRVYDRNNAVLK